MNKKSLKNGLFSQKMIKSIDKFSKIRSNKGNKVNKVKRNCDELVKGL